MYALNEATIDDMELKDITTQHPAIPAKKTLDPAKRLDSSETFYLLLIDILNNDTNYQRCEQSKNSHYWDINNFIMYVQPDGKVVKINPKDAEKNISFFTQMYKERAINLPTLIDLNRLFQLFQIPSQATEGIQGQMQRWPSIAIAELEQVITNYKTQPKGLIRLLIGPSTFIDNLNSLAEYTKTLKDTKVYRYDLELLLRLKDLETSWPVRNTFQNDFKKSSLCFFNSNGHSLNPTHKLTHTEQAIQDLRTKFANIDPSA